MERRFDRVAQAPAEAGGGIATTTDPTRGETARAVQNGTGTLGTEATPMRLLPITSDPAPLGLASFAATTFILSMFNSGLMGKAGEPIVLGMALAVGGIAQFVAGMWEFRTGNTFGAAAFTSYGAFWISFWAFEQFYASKITDPTTLGHAVGLYLIVWGVFTAYMTIASLRVSAAVCAVFVLLTATFLLLGIGNANASDSIIKTGGYVGLATAIAAWYASFAGVTNATFKRTVLPVKPLND